MPPFLPKRELSRSARRACAVHIFAFVNLCRLPSVSSVLVVTSAEAAATATAPAAADPMAPATFGSVAVSLVILGSENDGVPDLELPEVEVKCNN